MELKKLNFFVDKIAVALKKWWKEDRHGLVVLGAKEKEKNASV
jgi:hypothetical protein